LKGRASVRSFRLTVSMDKIKQKYKAKVTISYGRKHLSISVVAQISGWLII